MKNRHIRFFLVLVATSVAFNIFSVRDEMVKKANEDDDWDTLGLEDDGVIDPGHFESNSQIAPFQAFENLTAVENDASSTEVSKASKLETNKKENSSPSLSWSTTTVRPYDAQEYRLQLDETLTPLSSPNISTVANMMHFAGGLCNQYLSLIGAIFIARTDTTKYDQIVEESIPWKDLYGTNHLVPFNRLFDVAHWNTFHPVLPYIKRHDEHLHSQLKIHPQTVTIDGKEFAKAPRVSWNVTGDPMMNATQPFAIGGKRGVVWNQYKIFARRLDGGRMNKVLEEQHEIYRTILQGALRPHPEIQQMIDQYIANRFNGGKYMVLHARIEPDMNRHPMCRNRKVVNVTDIFGMVERQYEKPPVKSLLLTFNRDILEKEASVDVSTLDSDEKRDIHQMAVYNLNAINKALTSGLWSGRVNLVEAGTRLVGEASQNSFYRYYSSITGAIVNLFLNVQSDIFIGTEVSSFSATIVNARFYREQNENYFYRPEGLHWVTPPNVAKPYRFVC